MFESLFDVLSDSALACRRLYDVETGGYHLPPREQNLQLALADVDRCRAEYTTPMFDCIEAPVADLLFSLVVNTSSRWILETGTSRGFSTAHLAAGARFVGGESARVVTIDPSPAPNPFYANASSSPAVTAIRADSLAVDAAPLLGGAKLDFMFFDSLHTYAHLSGELVRFLPYLKAGGLFALHDTMVYDDLALVVACLAKSGLVEAVTLPTHRCHRPGSPRSPGVTVFRKIDRIDPGDLVFPDLDGVVEGERQSLAHPDLVVQRTGLLFLDRRYAAAAGLRDVARTDADPSLLEASLALVEEERPSRPEADEARLARIDTYASRPATPTLPLARHAAADAATVRANADWWQRFGPLEERLFRWLPPPFQPASQRRTLAALERALAGCPDVVHLACGAGPSAIGRRVDRRTWREAAGELPRADGYVLDRVLSDLATADIASLMARLHEAAPAGARIVLLEPVCFPGHPAGDGDRAIAASLAGLLQRLSREMHRERIELSDASRDARDLLTRRWLGTLPCGPAPLQRPFVEGELARLLGHFFDVREAPAVVEASITHDLARELLLLADDAPALAERLAAELLPAADALEALLLARPAPPDLSWYLSMATAVA